MLPEYLALIGLAIFLLYVSIVNKYEDGKDDMERIAESIPGNTYIEIIEIVLPRKQVSTGKATAMERNPNFWNVQLVTTPDGVDILITQYLDGEINTTSNPREIEQFLAFWEEIVSEADNELDPIVEY